MAQDPTHVPRGFEGSFAYVMLSSSREPRSHQEVVEAVTQEVSSRLKTWQRAHIGRKCGELLYDKICRTNPVFKSHVNGTEVFVRRNLSFAVYWAESQETSCTFVFRARQSSKGDGNFGRRYTFLWTLNLQVLVVRC
jgi:hypothetical protein